MFSKLQRNVNSDDDDEDLFDQFFLSSKLVREFIRRICRKGEFSISS